MRRIERNIVHRLVEASERSCNEFKFPGRPDSFGGAVDHVMRRRHNHAHLQESGIRLKHIQTEHQTAALSAKCFIAVGKLLSSQGTTGIGL